MAGRILIVGAGLAGLFTALKLAPHPVTVVAPRALGEGASSAWAQGGIAAAVGEGDSPEAHAADTIRAGAGLVDSAVARMVAEEGPQRVRDLLTYGVPFDRDLAGHFLLSREAAHSAKRIVRVSGDRAGHAIMQALISAVRRTPSIEVLEGYAAFELIIAETRVTGVRLVRDDDPAALFALAPAAAVVLATGGIGGLYRPTTNPPDARGGGIAMAGRAGALIADAEFVQFHPTAIDIGEDPAPLATEALRGEGAILVNGRGERFMPAIHPDAELAPRDVVARGVFRELQAGRGAFLDCRSAIGDRFAHEFPTVYARCRARGLDPARELVPVAPAEHYHMGGVKTDVSARTSLPGLWAVGEVACTGLHGANRLASNSLLEAVVFGARAAARIAGDTIDSGGSSRVARLTASPPQILDARNAILSSIRTTMSANAGVERDEGRLVAALRDLDDMGAQPSNDPIIENAVLTARFIVASALERRESRGAHFRRDHPDTRPELARSTVMSLADLERISSKSARSSH